jgi:predicted metal-dependent phosphoesterase TrpH
MQQIDLPDGLSLAEIHSHTLASDGIVSSSELICDAANAAGADVVPISAAR